MTDKPADSGNDNPAQTGIMMKIGCTITRNFGVETVSLSIEREVEIADRESRIIHFDVLYKVLNDQMAHYSSEFLPTVPKGASSQTDRNLEGVVVPVACTKIISETKDNKRYFKALGGQYTKHGVRVWDEVLEACDLLQQARNQLSIDLVGWTMDVLMVDGKPKRVVKLRENK